MTSETSENNSWALPAPQEGVAAAAGIPTADSAASAHDDGPGALLWVAGGLLVASALALVAQLFTHAGHGPAQAEFPEQLARESLAIVLAVGCAVLLLIRWTRRVAEGVACALGLLYSARDFNELRPSVINAAEGSIGYRLLAASLVLAAAAGAVVLVRILSEARRPRDRQTRADRGRRCSAASSARPSGQSPRRFRSSGSASATAPVPP